MVERSPRVVVVVDGKRRKKLRFDTAWMWEQRENTAEGDDR
jgi:hypothetical protein